MGHSLEFILNHPVLSVALFIFIYLIISYEIKNFTKKYKGINCNDLVTKINESQIAVLDTREKTEYLNILKTEVRQQTSEAVNLKTEPARSLELEPGSQKSEIKDHTWEARNHDLQSNPNLSELKTPDK